MQTEQVRIFDEKGTPIGIKSRADVHLNGDWHETFHCWMIGKYEQTYYVDIQLRSADKKDFPSMYDISAAGHLLSNESKEDGVRELEEELGMKVAYEDLTLLGTIADAISTPSIVDNEFCHVYLCDAIPHSVKQYHVQVEEIAGMFRMRWSDFKRVLSSFNEEAHATGFLMEDDQKSDTTVTITKKDFVPHSDLYVQAFIKAVDQVIANA
ncbi:NUDIX hydrolase [Alkalicoccobacillus gibsonii]|uniref:NUDIX hydrolase n=1 Tax=Alkalicoccobacillus gibsonii TaxID=79881 RepID=UPI003518E8D8